MTTNGPTRLLARRPDPGPEDPVLASLRATVERLRATLWEIGDLAQRLPGRLTQKEAARRAGVPEELLRAARRLAGSIPRAHRRGDGINRLVDGAASQAADSPVGQVDSVIGALDELDNGLLGLVNKVGRAERRERILRVATLLLAGLWLWELFS